MADHRYCSEELGLSRNKDLSSQGEGDISEEGIGMQVAQGNDSDSFACSCGSILGIYIAPIV